MHYSKFTKTGAWTFLSMIILLLLFAPACAWLKPAEDKAFQTVHRLIETTNAKVTAWCDAGYMPPYACAEWIELYAQMGDQLEHLKSRWSDLKAAVIDFLIRFLGGNWGIQPAEYRTGKNFRKPPPEPLLQHAEATADNGYLTNSELAALRAAAK